MNNTSAGQLSEQLAKEALLEISKTRRHANYRLLALLAIGIVTISWNILNTKSLFASSSSQIPDGEPYVSLVRIRGEITSESSSSAEFLKPILTKAFEDEEALGVILAINSPGGTPVQADLIHDHIVKLKHKHNKKVVAIGEDQLTSGAYLAAVAADLIYVNESTLAGSIGVVAQTKGFEKLANKVGIENRTITAGELKQRLDPFSALKQEDVDKMRKALSKIHDQFIDTVKLGRGDRLTGTPEELFSGDWWTGEEVVALGLVDGIGDISSVIDTVFNVGYTKDHTRRKGFLSSLTETMITSFVDRIVVTMENKIFFDSQLIRF